MNKKHLALAAAGVLFAALGGWAGGYAQGYAQKPAPVSSVVWLPMPANATAQAPKEGASSPLQAPAYLQAPPVAQQAAPVVIQGGHQGPSGAEIMGQAMVGTMIGNALSPGQGHTVIHHTTTGASERRPLVVRRDVPKLPASQALAPTVTPRAPAPIPSVKRLTASAQVVSGEERTIQRRIQAQDGLTRAQAGAATADLRRSALVAPPQAATISNTTNRSSGSSFTVSRPSAPRSSGWSLFGGSSSRRSGGWSFRSSGRRR